MKDKQVPGKKQPAHSPSAKPASSGNLTFIQFMSQRPQSRELLFTGAGLVVLYLLIGYLYPVPGWYYDTANYLQSAEAGTFSGYRPYGYSWFLVAVKNFSPTMRAVYFFQYWLNAIACLYFVFTVKYLFRPASKWVYAAFVFFVIFSPSILYMTDYVMSDSVFVSLTLMWITSCMWILHNRSIAAIFIHALTFWGLLHVRYSALFYPVFSVAVFFIAYKNRKAVAVALSLVPVLICWQVYSYNKTKMKKLVNVNIFSGFSGWVVANNAVHILPWIDLKPGDIKDPEVRRIHEFSRQLPDSVYKRNGICSYYMWEKEYPFKKYLFQRLSEEQLPYLHGWVRTSIDFGKYGNLLIRKYPLQFFTHYLLPNTKEAIYPSLGAADELSTYRIMPSDNKWFEERPEEYVQPEHPVYNTWFAPHLPLAVFLQWLLVAAGLALTFVFRKRLAYSASQWYMFFLLLAFMLAYVAANIYGAPFVIRYGLPVHGIQTILIFLPLFALIRPGGRTIQS